MCVGNIEDETRWTIEGIKRILALEGADLTRCRESDRLSSKTRATSGATTRCSRSTSRTGGSAAPRSRRAPSSSARSKWTQSRTNRDAAEQADAKCVRQGWHNEEGDESMLRLLGRNTSGNVQKVIFLLEELGAPYAREDYGRQFNNTQDAAYLKLNPNGKVPTLVDGDTVIWESNTILRYLAAKHEKDALYPTDPAARTAGRALDGLAAGCRQLPLRAGVQGFEEGGERARARPSRPTPRSWRRSSRSWTARWRARRGSRARTSPSPTSRWVRSCTAAWTSRSRCRR